MQERRMRISRSRRLCFKVRTILYKRYGGTIMKQEPEIAAVNKCIYGLCELLFSHSITEKKVRMILKDVENFVRDWNLYFYYRHVPILNADNVLHRTDIIKNIYMLRLIEDYFNNSGLRVSHLIDNYKCKFNLL